MLRTVRFLALAAMVASCGGSSPTGPGGLTGDGLVAKIGGTSFGTTTVGAANHSVAGGYVISAVSSSGSNAQSITLLLTNIPGPGTYPLGTGAGVAGGTAIYVSNSAGWGTALTGDAGTVTLTTVSDTRITGSFSFTADASTGGATGTKSVSNGAFDLPVTTTGSPGAVSARNLNVLKATMGGQSYNAATIASGSSSGSIIASGLNTKYALSIAFTNLTAPGTYAVGNAVLSSVVVGAGVGGSSTGPGCCWGTFNAGSTGSVIVTALTATQVIGTFSFTLQPGAPGGATTPLTIINGEFTIGR